MFISKARNEDESLDKVIDELLASMHDVDTDSEEYSKKADQLVKLYKLKEVDASKRVNPDTLIVAGANLLGIVLIVGHERAHIVTSKAKDFVLKLR